MTEPTPGLPGPSNEPGSKPQGSPLKKPAFAFAISTAFVGVLLSSFGYGVLISVAHLGMTHWGKIGSTMDLLDLSGLAVMWTWHRGGIALSRALPALLDGTWTMDFRAAAGMALPLLLWALRPHLIRRKREAAADRGEVEAQSGPSGWRRPAIALGLRSLLSLAAGGVAGVMTLSIGALLAMTLTLPVVLLPMVGYAAGGAYIQAAVIDPDECDSVEPLLKSHEKEAQEVADSQQQEVRPTTALCVEVRSDKETSHEGRVVFATSVAMLLYDPGTGSSKWVPLDGATVTKIGKLSAPPSDKHTPAVASDSADGVQGGS